MVARWSWAGKPALSPFGIWLPWVVCFFLLAGRCCYGNSSRCVICSVLTVHDLCLTLTPSSPQHGFCLSVANPLRCSLLTRLYLHVSDLFTSNLLWPVIIGRHSLWSQLWSGRLRCDRQRLCWSGMWRVCLDHSQPPLTCTVKRCYTLKQPLGVNSRLQEILLFIMYEDICLQMDNIVNNSTCISTPQSYRAYTSQKASVISWNMPFRSPE